uniref:Uncharacterized protein n=1 Tax=Plectus sambesii TaxID=2011161 RepID=A0A914W3R0_9BILA
MKQECKDLIEYSLLCKLIRSQLKADLEEYRRKRLLSTAEKESKEMQKSDGMAKKPHDSAEEGEQADNKNEDRHQKGMQEILHEPVCLEIGNQPTRHTTLLAIRHPTHANK